MPAGTVCDQFNDINSLAELNEMFNYIVHAMLSYLCYRAVTAFEVSIAVRTYYVHVIIISCS